MKGVNKLLTVSSLSLLLSLLGIGAYAAEQSGSSEHTHSTKSMSSTHLRGEHSMAGTIDEIDHSTGEVELNTQAGDLKLHFPPAAVKDLKKGDKITVHLGFSEASGAMQK